MSRRRNIVVIFVAIAVVLAACGSSGSTKTTSPTTVAGPSAFPVSTALGPGITANQIKLGIALIDFSCVRQYTDTIREHQDVNYNVYIDDINKHGGIDGRQIVPMLPHVNSTPIGSDPRRSARSSPKTTRCSRSSATCSTTRATRRRASRRRTRCRSWPSSSLTRSSTVAAGPRSSIAGTVARAHRAVLMQLVKQQGTLDGKKVGVLGESREQERREEVHRTAYRDVDEAQGVKMGTIAILRVAGTDTTTAQAQLDSLHRALEDRRRERDLGDPARRLTSQAVHEKIKQANARRAAPHRQPRSCRAMAQQLQQGGEEPEPVSRASSRQAARPHKEYDASENWKRTARSIYKAQIGKTPPNAGSVLTLPDGKIDDDVRQHQRRVPARVAVPRHHGEGRQEPRTCRHWQNAVNTTARSSTAVAVSTRRSPRASTTSTTRSGSLQFDSSIASTATGSRSPPLQNITGARVTARVQPNEPRAKAPLEARRRSCVPVLLRRNARTGCCTWPRRCAIGASGSRAAFATRRRARTATGPRSSTNAAPRRSPNSTPRTDAVARGSSRRDRAHGRHGCRAVPKPPVLRRDRGRARQARCPRRVLNTGFSARNSRDVMRQGARAARARARRRVHRWSVDAGVASRVLAWTDADGNDGASRPDRPAPSTSWPRRHMRPARARRARCTRAAPSS